MECPLLIWDSLVYKDSGWCCCWAKEARIAVVQDGEGGKLGQLDIRVLGQLNDI